MTSARNCPICGGSRFGAGRFGLLRCGDCAIVVSPSIWLPQVNESLEEEWFGEESQAEPSAWVRWFEARNNARTLARLEELGLPGKRLLEIGIGSGSFLKAAREAGFDAMGCDLSPAIAARVTRSSGVPVHCGPLSGIQGTGFDVIVMNHVVEHVPQPLAFLRDAKRLLSPGGTLHIAVPNVACWEAKLSGWTSYEPYHLLYFTPETLRGAVSRAGLAVDRESTHESFSGWFLALLRTMLRVNTKGRITDARAARGDAPHARRASIVDHAYRAAMVAAGVVTAPLRFLQARAGRGDEAIVIARQSHG